MALQSPAYYYSETGVRGDMKTNHVYRIRVSDMARQLYPYHGACDTHGECKEGAGDLNDAATPDRHAYIKDG